MYLGGIGVFDSSSAPRSGLSRCSIHPITSHLCCWNPGNFRLVPRGRYECWLFKRGLRRCSSRALWRLLTSPARAGEGNWGLEACHRSVCPQRLRDADKVQDGDSGDSLGVYREGGLDVLDKPQGRLLPDSHPSGLLTVPSVLSWESCRLPVLCPVLWPVHSSTGVYQGLRSETRVGALEGYVPPPLSALLADWAESVPLLLRHWDLVLQLCRDLGIVIN